MKNNKIIAFVMALILSTSISNAQVKLEEVSSPLDIMYRFGTTDVPETRIDSSNQIDLRTEDIEIKPTVSVKTDSSIGKTYADLSIKSMAMEISKAIEMDYDDMLADLSLLWQGAATNSDTIKFAIYKLSNPEKDKPDESAVKKVLSTIAGMSTFLGAGSGNPMFASAALIGGNTLGIMSQDTKALNYKYTQVTDAEMIILVRKVHELQQKVVDVYYDYMTAKKLYDITTEQVRRCEANYKKSLNQKREVVLVTDTFYREALDEQLKARGTFFEKRSQLQQIVGNDIFTQFENSVDKRTHN